MLELKNLIIILSISVFISSCTSSYIYSPSLNLSDRSLKKDQVDIKLGLGLLPETRPDTSIGKTTVGGFIELGYGITKDINIYGSVLHDFSDKFSPKRSAFALSSRISLINTEKEEILFHPRAGIMVETATVGAYGFELPIIYLNRPNDNFYYYFGAGFAFGFKELNRINYPYLSNSYNYRYPIGYGVISHLGLGYNLRKNIRLNFELDPIFQINYYDKVNNVIISPTINLCFLVD